MTFFLGLMMGIIIYSFFRCIVGGFYTVSPDQRAIVTSFGKAQRLEGMQVADGDADSDGLSDEEHQRYEYPQVRVVGPGGPYFKMPWQDVHKVSVATQAVDLSWDPSKAQDTIEAVTKDNLTTGINGQLRYRISESNLYPYLFGVASPLEHVMGYFVSVLRERVANFVDPKGQTLLVDAEVDEADGDQEESSIDLSEGVSINDLRKNLPLLNQYMEEQCRSTTGRYGIELDAALITEIDPPAEVDRALSAINSTRNQVAADLSTARADSEQQITMSARAVEIATNNAQAEVAPLRELAQTLTEIKKEGGSSCLQAYLRNARIPLYNVARRVIQTTKTDAAG
ncbi:SPFH domain / Band 7 family protein [Stieleria maiorica]|uniref:SPFH domain / Band 7 family protein n=1 Tax=Stieleria maiorica TaxID=2795974 RepID=A0A5B9MFG6_9BACT|nr:SPFH domain-containing protein [Stieleria maiorica]QEF99878.1 SPFH domain / Band 7 family protein [Stieleria maiorica]